MPGRPLPNTILCGLLLAAALHAGSSPVPVSPGGATAVPIADSCPTFSWSSSAHAIAHELRVHRIEADGQATLLYSQTFDGQPESWTPSLGRCFEPGRRYRWSVRARMLEAASDWAPPFFFEVAQAPTPVELAERLRVARRYLRAATGTGEAVASEAVPLPAGTVGEPATLLVKAEVRTVDASGSPRLWGRGQDAEVFVEGSDPCLSQGLKFGLSRIGVDWGSAAIACPAGTWVCESSEIDTEHCDTDRTDSELFDAFDCDATWFNFDPGSQRGWTADASSSRYRGTVVEEQQGGGSFSAQTCGTFPVWCCWE